MATELVITEVTERFGQTEGRVLLSGAIVVVTLTVLALISILVRRTHTLYRRYVTRSVETPVAEMVNDVVDWPFPTKAVVRILQIIAIGAAAVLLLTVWGYENQARMIGRLSLELVPYISKILVSGAILLGGVIANRVFKQWIKSYAADATHVNEHQERVTYRVVQVSVLLFVLMLILAVWEIDLGGILIGAGFLGIVLGLAAQQTLGNLIAGFVLMFAKPFTIGDWVQIGEQEGVVTDITIMTTRIRTFDDETVVIPNDTVSNRTVINMTASDRLRLTLPVGIEYGADIEQAEEIATQALEDVEMILSVPKPTVVPRSFDDSAIGLELRFWIEPPTAPRKIKAEAAVLRAVKEAFNEEDIGIPFPQRELSGRVKGMDGGPSTGQ